MTAILEKKGQYSHVLCITLFIIIFYRMFKLKFSVNPSETTVSLCVHHDLTPGMCVHAVKQIPLKLSDLSK